jgi:branched-chain amino acid transport system permease protein
MKPHRRWRAFAALAAAAVVWGCSGVDAEQARICQMLLPALEQGAGDLNILGSAADPDAENTVIVRYRVPTAAGISEDHWISCQFAGAGFEPDKRHLTGVATDRQGRLSDVEMHMLRRFWLGRFPARTEAGAGQSPVQTTAALPALYFLQQTVNALTVSCVYALLAVAYTLVYAIVGRINLAFGEFAMIGSYVTLLAIHVLAAGDAGALLVMPVAILLAVLVTGLHGWAAERTVFRPLRGSGSQSVLIATVGLAIFLQEYVRLTQGARDRWLQPVLSDVYLIARSEGFPVTITAFQILIVVVTVGLFAAHRRFIDGGRFGRAWNACAQDPGMAGLCGIDPGRTTALTFALGAGYAGVAGTVIALYYGGVGFYMGTVLGFKALTAAVVGGIGSVGGAVLGGILIGVLETFWSGYLSVAYRDVAVFGVLALVLIFRPGGLVGGAWTRGD